MKKKLIFIPIIIVFVIALSLGLAACNRASTQGLLANILNDHSSETFVYSVYNSELDSTVGEYTVNLKAYSKGSEITNFGDATLSNVDKGILVTGNLSLTDGTIYNTGCYFKLISGSSYMIPAYTYRVQSDNSGVKFKLQGTYNGSTLNYTKVVNGESSTNKIKVSGTYYDNNEFHQTLRTITTFSTSLSFSFAIPFVSENENAEVKLTASCTSKGTVTCNAKDVECYVVNIARSTEVAGVKQTLYYATSNMMINGWAIKNALVKIEEPFKKNNTQYKMVYTLKSASIA